MPQGRSCSIPALQVIGFPQATATTVGIPELKYLSYIPNEGFLVIGIPCVWEQECIAEHQSRKAVLPMKKAEQDSKSPSLQLTGILSPHFKNESSSLTS